MVRVSWECETGELVSVEPEDGPGEFTSGGDTAQVEQKLKQIDDICEKTIVSTLLDSYQGTISNRDLTATAESYSAGENTGIKTTLAFLEPSTLEGRLTRIKCSNCEYSPDHYLSWSVQQRAGEEFDYRDWSCPHCNQVVHTDVVE